MLSKIFEAIQTRVPSSYNWTQKEVETLANTNLLKCITRDKTLGILITFLRDFEYDYGCMLFAQSAPRNIS